MSWLLPVEQVMIVPFVLYGCENTAFLWAKNISYNYEYLKTDKYLELNCWISEQFRTSHNEKLHDLMFYHVRVVWFFKDSEM